MPAMGKGGPFDSTAISVRGDGGSRSAFLTPKGVSRIMQVDHGQQLSRIRSYASHRRSLASRCRPGRWPWGGIPQGTLGLVSALATKKIH
jgi:hypothetical protein